MSNVLEYFRCLHKDVGSVMHYEHETSATNQVARIGENYQQDSNQVVHEHFEEVFPLNVHELRKQQRPVAAQLEDVIKLDIPRKSLGRKVIGKQNIDECFKVD